MLLVKSQWNHLMETTKFILIGCGGYARVIFSIVEAQKAATIVWLFDTDSEVKTLGGIENFGAYTADTFPNSLAIIAIGNNQIREKLAYQITHDFGVLVHPTASIDRITSIDEGTVVHHAVIQRGTAVGKHVIINTSSSIDHDCKLEDFVQIAPNATLCGGVDVGKGSLNGVGSVVLPQVKIGANVTLGAGTIVAKNIPDGSMVIGNPGKIIDSNGAI